MLFNDRNHPDEARGYGLEEAKTLMQDISKIISVIIFDIIGKVHQHYKYL